MTSHTPDQTGSSPGSIFDAGQLRYAVIAASARKQRMGKMMADWVVDQIPRDTVEVDLIDLAECELPDDALLEPGGSGPPTAIADRIGAADGFVVVTPEYNHSYPASLKRVIDWHYREWMFKPVTVVSYGVQGGVLATEHLRAVFAELSMVTTRRVVGLRAPWEHLGEAGYDPEPGVADAVTAAVGELGWWAQILHTARRDYPFPG